MSSKKKSMISNKLIKMFKKKSKVKAMVKTSKTVNTLAAIMTRTRVAIKAITLKVKEKAEAN